MSADGCTCGMIVPESLQQAILDGSFTGSLVPVPMHVFELYPTIDLSPDIGCVWLRDGDCPYHRDRPLRWNRTRGIYFADE